MIIGRVNLTQRRNVRFGVAQFCVIALRPCRDGVESSRRSSECQFKGSAVVFLLLWPPDVYKRQAYGIGRAGALQSKLKDHYSARIFV